MIVLLMTVKVKMMQLKTRENEDEIESKKEFYGDSSDEEID